MIWAKCGSDVFILNQKQYRHPSAGSLKISIERERFSSTEKPKLATKLLLFIIIICLPSIDSYFHIFFLSSIDALEDVFI